MPFGFTSRVTGQPTERELQEIRSLLAANGLVFEGQPDFTAIAEDDGGKIVATASLDGNVIKMVAAESEYRESGLSGVVITELLRCAAEHSLFHLFLYTKPDASDKFASVGFRELARTADVVFMESGSPSADDFRAGLEAERFSCAGKIYGAAVMNCNPFTLGHRYLIEKAAERCDGLYVIVVEEDISEFPFADRVSLVRRGTEGIKNVKVLPSGPYAISRATFPSYFLKDRSADSVAERQAELDIALFAKLYVPALSLSVRFVGTEPFSETTRMYNRKMSDILPRSGVEVIELPRLCDARGKAISASEARSGARRGDSERLSELLPDITLRYLAERGAKR